MTETSDFDYHLPPEYIAQVPLVPRDSARLMVLDRATKRIEHRIFQDIGGYFSPGDLLVLNNTRVIPARLLSRKAGSGGRVEILLLEQKSETTWLVLVGGKKVRVGTVLNLLDTGGEKSGIRATVKSVKAGGQRIVEFSEPSESWLWQIGGTPLPPYITGYTGHPERYQTVYAHRDGSSAAPTAGLHFTKELLESLKESGVRLAFVTLQIGLDTFQPIKGDRIDTHPIHTEWAQLDTETAQLVNQTRRDGGRVIAVGTTTVRTLETAALNPASSSDIGAWLTVVPFQGFTNLYIMPGHRFRAVDSMITNFHLPRSTLMILVSAFAGIQTIRDAYAAAVENQYRFYSFGDAMLIL